MKNNKFHLPQRGNIFVVLLSFVLVVMFSCEEKQYEINQDFYKDKTVVVKNPMDNDTLRINKDNTDQIMLEEPNDSTVVFDNRGFIFTVEDESVVTIAEDGLITPKSKGISRVNIVSRANAGLSTSIVIEIYKEYCPVEEIRIPEEVAKNTIIELGQEPYDLAKGIVIFPANADNHQLHFSMEATSLQYATITDDGKMTAVKASGRYKANVLIVSDDNPNITATVGVSVVTEIVISEVTVLKALDGLTIGVGATVDLNLCTGVLPSNVNVNNRKLTFEVRTGQDVVSVDANGMLKATAEGTATVRAISKNDKYKNFTINVKNGLTDLTRVLWTVKTSVDYGYAPDNATGMPEDMFDNVTTTYFSVVKPGKTYLGNTTPAGHIPYFIVDMKAAQKFNYIRWNHRTGNSSAYLRVWGIDFAGSNDGENFTDIQTGIDIPHDSNSAAINIAIPESNYRYVKVSLTKWSDNSGGEASGGTMQVAEFGLGYK